MTTLLPVFALAPGALRPGRSASSPCARARAVEQDARPVAPSGGLREHDAQGCRPALPPRRPGPSSQVTVRGLSRGPRRRPLADVLADHLNLNPYAQDAGRDRAGGPRRRSAKRREGSSARAQASAPGRDVRRGYAPGVGRLALRGPPRGLAGASRCRVAHPHLVTRAGASCSGRTGAASRAAAPHRRVPSCLRSSAGQPLATRPGVCCADLPTGPGRPRAAAAVRRTPARATGSVAEPS